MRQADSTAPAATLGERNLSTVHAVAQSLAIGPMFSVALILGGISRPDIGAGWNAALAVLIATLGVLAIGYVVALYARRFAGAGAVYEYLTHGAHPWVGVLVAGFFFIGVLFLGGGGIYLGLGILIDGFWTAHISDSGPAWWLWGAIALAIVLALNYIGVRIAVRAMLTFATLSFIPMLILAIHRLLFRPVDTGGAAQALEQMARAALRAFGGEPGALTPDVFWVRGGRWAQVTSYASGKRRMLRGTGLREALKGL